MLRKSAMPHELTTLRKEQGCFIYQQFICGIPSPGACAGQARANHIAASSITQSAQLPFLNSNLSVRHAGDKVACCRKSFSQRKCHYNSKNDHYLDMMLVGDVTVCVLCAAGGMTA